jgi:hypothetical protein
VGKASLASIGDPFLRSAPRRRRNGAYATAKALSRRTKTLDETVPSGIGGVLATVHETTEQVIGQRRGLVLRDLGSRSGEAKTAEEATRRI